MLSLPMLLSSSQREFIACVSSKSVLEPRMFMTNCCDFPVPNVNVQVPISKSEVERTDVGFLPENHGSIRARLPCHQMNVHTTVSLHTGLGGQRSCFRGVLLLQNCDFTRPETAVCQAKETPFPVKKMLSSSSRKLPTLQSFPKSMPKWFKHVERWGARTLWYATTALEWVPTTSMCSEHVKS